MQFSLVDDESGRTLQQPQRSSSLSYKGHQQQQMQIHRQQRRSPMLGAGGSNSNNSSPRMSGKNNSGPGDFGNSDDDDEIPLQTRPASFAAPPSLRYNHHTNQQYNTTLAGRMESSSTHNNAEARFQTRATERSQDQTSSAYQHHHHNPTPSTSELPYNSFAISYTAGFNTTHVNTNNDQQQQQTDPSWSSTPRNRQGSGGSAGSSSSARQRQQQQHNLPHQQQDNGMHSHAPRRSRSVENNNDPSGSSFASSASRQYNNNNHNGPTGSSSSSSSSSSRHLNPPNGGQPVSSSSSSSGGPQKKQAQLCAKCNTPMTGQFVRALGTVFHLDCFRCQDCNKIVAAKFFPVDGPDGKQYPLCETDYFRRLSLICAKCGMALRGSYITALDMKFHVEHFTCSVCPTVFGPQDSYYEHGGQVYCHFHYSTRFAVKCTGCKTAILKQFVEINRNNVDEHWHPECYMIHKFWNIKLVPSSKKSLESSPNSTQMTGPDSSDATSGDSPPKQQQQQMQSQISKSSSASSSYSGLDWEAQERLETAHSLREKQKHVEAQVYRIWTVLSTFEESSAACISEMLRHVSNGHYLDGVKMAEKFVLHVETLFAAIDDLNAAFRHLGSKEIPHVREARMLCKKVVNFFSLLSHTHESGARKMGITQDLLSLVTGLAHYLKILIRIALTAALKLERDYASKTALAHFLSRLDRLCRDPEIAKAAASPVTSTPGGTTTNGEGSTAATSHSRAIEAGPSSTKSRPCGYKSLARPGGSFINQLEGEAITDLCEACHLTVEEECARFGTTLRWHLQCLCCSVCQRHASKEKDPAKLAALSRQQSADSGEQRKPLLYLKEFRIELFDKRTDGNGPATGGSGRYRESAGKLYCSECPSGSIQDGFEYVTRLEQYAFLLCVALNKLYYLLKRRGVLASSPSAVLVPGQDDDERSIHEAYRDSNDIKRMKSVNLDRKISTTARVAQRLTVVESPRGRTATAQAGVESGQAPRSDEPVNSIRHVQPQHPQSQSSSPYQGSVSPIAPSTSPLVPQRELVPNEMQQQHQQYLRHQQQQQQAAFHQQQQQQIQQAYRDQQESLRPAINRTNTAIRVVEDQPPIEHGAFRDIDLLGSERSPVQDEDGITLADLHQVMEAEQAREQRGDVPRHSQMLLSELSALEYFIVKHAAAITLASDVPPYRDFAAASLDELLDMIDAKKNNFWGKLFKGSSKEKKEVKKKGTFGVPLELLVERHGTDSMLGTGPGSVRIPTFIDDIISAMKQMDLSVEGIFRKNGNIRRLKELADTIDRDPDSVNLSDDNPVQIAALLKKFLRDLPDPLLTFRLQHLFLATQHIDNDEDRRKILHLVMCLMPKHHRDTMEVLFVFLKWVASFSHVDEETGSKMDLQNLATVICPNILYSRGKDASKDESFLGIRAVSEMLQYQDVLFTVPAELTGILADQDLFSNPAELSSKDILKKAEVHLREHQRVRERGPHSDHHHQQQGFRTGFRGEVKHTHPRYHAPFSPASTQRPYENGHGAATGSSPRFGHQDRPLSWQALPSSNPMQQQYQQYAAQQQQSQQMPTSPYGSGPPSGMLSPGLQPNFRQNTAGPPPTPSHYRPPPQH